MHPDPVEVRTVERSDIPQAIDFVMQARAELFPTLAGAGVPGDLAQFEQVYLNGAGRFVLAREGGKIVVIHRADRLADLLAWYRGLPAERQAEVRAGITREKEAEVLKAWKAKQGS